MDRMSLMHSFVTVARIGSFSGAAKTLNFSGSLVSRHVAELERQLGVRLVNRTARSISLTEHGVRYAEFAARILKEIETEDASISHIHDRAEGHLSVIAPQWIGSLDLGDAMAAFSTAYPRISVRFELGGLSDRMYDFLDSGFDVALHARDLRDSSVRLRKVAALPFVLCASPEYLARHGAPARPDDLADHDCVVHTEEPTWRLGQGRAAVQLRVRNVVYSSNSHLALRKAAVHGRGVALLPQTVADDDLRSGGLREVLPQIGVPERPLYAIYGPGEAVPRKVSVFLEFLAAWFKDHRPTTLHLLAAPADPRPDGVRERDAS
ncbi:putative LysR family transcriptional regulator [Actinacidiphila reveromycinica]|uniref:Putative LysR family transcriptional regulator n=1 Tax=Actinacidiphila reveromycinica TaxID=659352 RepID=A0A7U3UPK0_9ACTN|nr:LysR family transcriptional regulator [Streptomyces sp. SN-593]BBA96340.1 putative LysR family transcriptional regulator [Streptomyces sp. SN-593]